MRNLELENRVYARFIRYDHVYCYNEYLAISELRVLVRGKKQNLLRQHILKQNVKKTEEIQSFPGIKLKELPDMIFTGEFQKSTSIYQY
ncbi:hypothetical protein [Gillisia sp. JM1]|uniref:hypothetical protein n=1 Tax=Gillisia sp. JM1 TaxID=1283286 RepID=UPI00047D96A2|nr:hypothetical protein [Gillisia sp. JM1]